MSSYRSEILQFPNRVMYAELEAYRINIWANVFPMIYCYVFIFRNPHTMKPILTRELDLFPIIDFGNWNRFPSLPIIQYFRSPNDNPYQDRAPRLKFGRAMVRERHRVHVTASTVYILIWCNLVYSEALFLSPQNCDNISGRIPTGRWHHFCASLSKTCTLSFTGHFKELEHFNLSCHIGLILILLKRLARTLLLLLLLSGIDYSTDFISGFPQCTFRSTTIFPIFP